MQPNLGILSSACRTRTLLPDQQGKPRKQEVAAGVIDYIYLAGIKTRFERCQRHIELEDGGLSLARIQFRQFDQRAFVGFGFTLKKATLDKSRMPGLLASPLAESASAGRAGSYTS